MKYPLNTPDVIENAIGPNLQPSVSQSPIALPSPPSSYSPDDYDPLRLPYAIAARHEKEDCAVQPAPPHKQNMNIPYESRCLRDDENQQYDPLTRRQNADFVRGNMFSDRYKTKYQEYSVEMPTMALPNNTFVVDSYFYPFPDFYYRYNSQYKSYPMDNRFTQTKPEYTFPYLVTNYPFLTEKRPFESSDSSITKGVNIEEGFIGNQKSYIYLFFALLIAVILIKMYYTCKTNKTNCTTTMITLLALFSILVYMYYVKNVSQTGYNPVTLFMICIILFVLSIYDLISCLRNRKMFCYEPIIMFIAILVLVMQFVKEYNITI
jgi:hypothetical protein